MRLHLKVKDGPLKGKKVSLSKKTSFGRKGADFDLNDPKASGIHGFFEYQDGEGWVVVDNGSRNGVWLNDLKESRALLKDGDELRVGSTIMVCRIFAKGGIQFSEKLSLWLEKVVKKIPAQPASVKEIKPEVRLSFIQGVQYGENWVIFYGPRHAGKGSSDLCLFDEKAPTDAFEIKVKGKYAYFVTRKSDLVKLNSESVQERQLKPGDVISFGETQIAVEFDEGHGFGR